MKAIEDKIPGIKPANRELGDLLTTRNVVAPKLATRQNNDVVGAFAPIAFGAARNDALGAGMAAVTLADRNPFVKSYLAHKLFQGRPGYYGGLLGGAYIGGGEDLLDLINRQK